MVDARRFDARIAQNIREHDDVLVRAVESCCKQMPQVVRKDLPRVDARNELSRTFYQKNKQQYYLLHYACCVCHLAV